MSINFHDGQPNDVAILKQFNPIAKSLNEREEDVDNCIFDGFLKNEEKVYVTLTGGCPFEESFDVSKDLKNILQDMTALRSTKPEAIHQIA